MLDVPLTVKMRTGVQERVSLAHRLLPELRDWGVALVTVGVGQCGHTSGFLWLSRFLVLSLCLVSCCLSVPPPALHLLIPSACYLHLQPSLLLPHPQLHGRSREQRYTRLADWPYIEQCAKVASPMPLFGRYPEPLGSHLSTGKTGRDAGSLGNLQTD